MSLREPRRSPAAVIARTARSAGRKAGKLAVAGRTPLTRRALARGVAPSTEHLTVLRLTRPATVLDVGANAGQFALAARLAGCRGDIYSFEPLPGPAAVFRAIFASDARTHLVQRALSDTAGTSTLHESRRADCSSLLEIGDQQLELFPGTGEARRVQVDVSRLADEIHDVTLQSPTLLKIDVQGGELAVLRGAGPALADVDHVYLEVSFVRLYDDQPLADEIVRHLFDRGFHLAGIGDTSVVAGCVIQADFLFSRSLPG